MTHARDAPGGVIADGNELARRQASSGRAPQRTRANGRDASQFLEGALERQQDSASYQRSLASDGNTLGRSDATSLNATGRHRQHSA